MVKIPFVLLAVIISSTSADLKEKVTYQETITTNGSNFTKTKESSVIVKLNSTLSSIEFQFHENDGSFKSWLVFYEKVCVGWSTYRFLRCKISLRGQKLLHF